MKRQLNKQHRFIKRKADNRRLLNKIRKLQVTVTVLLFVPRRNSLSNKDYEDTNETF